MKSICRYCFSILLLMVISAINLNAQTPNENTPVPTSADTSSWYNGLVVGTDLLNPIAGAMGKDYSSYEVSVEYGLKRKYFPIAEVGMSKSDNTSDFGPVYHSPLAPYGRVGINYAFSQSAKSFAYIGTRVGFSNFSYDVSNMTITSNYWKESLTTSLNREKSNAIWTEFIGGLRVSITNHILMGWNVRAKFINHVKQTLYGSPAYIPGYGSNKSKTYGIQFSIYYKF
ncbi:DUF6048 family protein [Parabacteroides sp. FAFU027]|uniref:DUF6048 family protein n=1 Tax=Parabacteroides sp. FAFU027 TaxID=2922715 RepID=UPI001FAEB3ED|nr:DUF6048 family protein [Parabacteroides sp. FAFU027]